jgi:hypothetical protein
MWSFFSVSALTLMFHLGLFVSAASSLIETNIPCREGFEKGWFEAHVFTRNIFGVGPRAGQINTIYMPRTGLAWVGAWSEHCPSIIDDRIISVIPELQGSPERLRFSVSTNKYPAGLTNFLWVMQAELAGYTNGARTPLSIPPYTVTLETLLGSATLRDFEDTNMFFDLTFSNVTRPSKFKEMTVVGTNAVLALEIGTNITARIAFNKHIVPVWATTNGVSIGPIPTNCVFYSDIVSNKVVTRVIY